MLSRRSSLITLQIFIICIAKFLDKSISKFSFIYKFYLNEMQRISIHGRKPTSLSFRENSCVENAIHFLRQSHDSAVGQKVDFFRGGMRAKPGHQHNFSRDCDDKARSAF